MTSDPASSTTTTPSGLSRLVARLADDMAARWRAGDDPLAEEYLEQHPELCVRPDVALELLVEELALRHEHERTTSLSELARRFPRWRLQVETLWRCQRALGSAGTERMPEPGDEIGGFRLLHELGRGAHGRVFLATQSALGERAVVLKLAPGGGDEHRSLARLQHSHIVPLHSAHEFPEHGLWGLCLPYFGRTTLAALLAHCPERHRAARTGAHVLSALRDVESRSPVPLPVGGPACDRIRQSSFVDAVCGIGISLADALEHAHSRGLLHLDVKPSNVLIAADGVPMLLDFHLARPPLSAGAAPPAWLGGTPEYMAPELAAAVEAVRRGEPVPGAVDGRADVYSLGLLLGEALGRAAGAKHPDVPTGLSDILARCTAPDPADRYASTAQVAADLRRHLADLPLRGVPNRSAGERWRKWRRRSPLTLPGLVIGTACALLAVGFGLDADTRIERARTALREGELHLQSGRFTESVETFRGGETRLKGVPFTAALGHKLRTGRANAERARAATELHQFCERVRPFYAAELVTTADASEAFARCRELWAQRQQIAANLDEQPASELDRRWRADVLDVGILTAHLLARRAAPAEREAAHRQALAILDEAGSLLGPSAGLYRERAVHARALGFQALEAEANSRAASVPPRTAWEHLIAGRTFFAAGDFARAATAFDQSLELDPGSLWGNNYRGLTLLRLSDFNGAAAAFSVCVALAPRTAWCYTNRGLAHTEAGRLDRAGVDFDRALAIDPNGAAALIGRATVRYRSGRFAEAHADLRLAHAAGAPAATVHYHAAAVHLAAGDRRAAVAALRDCLVSDPHHPDARSALARLDPNP